MKVNNLIKIMTFSDFLVVSGWGLVSPLFAVFVTKQIVGGNIELVGLSTAVYWILRASLQLPFARLIDSKKGEIDDFVVMAIGSVLTSVAPFLFIFAKTNIHVLFLQGLTGFAAAMVAPAWLAIFTRHIDKHVEAEEWGLYNAMVGLGIGLTGALSGFLAEKLGFQSLYFVVGVICTFGSLFLFFVYQDLRRAERKLT